MADDAMYTCELVSYCNFFYCTGISQWSIHNK